MNPYCKCSHLMRQHSDDGFGRCFADRCDCQQFNNNEIKVAPEPESILVQKARHELALGDFVGASDPFVDFDTKIIEIVKIFASMGHSGSSAEFTRNIIDKLLRQQPLTPITDDPDEWEEHDASKWDGKNKIWQNKRDSRALSTDAGVSYFLVTEARRSRLNSVQSKNGPRGEAVRARETPEIPVSPVYDR